MAGAEGLQEKYDELVLWQQQTMAVLGRVFDDSTEEGRTLLARLLEQGETFLLMDGLNKILDDLDHLRAARLEAIRRLREGGDGYAAAIVQGHA